MKETNVAIAVDSVLTTKKVNMATIFKSLERDHKMNIKASWSGIEAHLPDRRIYKHGTYTETGASDSEQRFRYRLRLMRFVRWLYEQSYMTPELVEARKFFEEQEEW